MAGFGRTISRAMIPAVVAAMVAGTAGAQASESGVAGPYLAAIHAEVVGDVGAAARLFAEALSRDRDNLELLESAMMHQIAAGNVPQGIELAKRLEQEEPGHHLGVLALAAADLKAGDPQAAAELLADDAPFVGQVMDAWAAYAADDTARAIEVLTKLEQSEDNGRPGQIVAAYHLGLIQAASGDDEAAAESFARAAEMSEGGTLRLARLQAGALARLGRKDEAMAVIEERLVGTYGSRTLSQVSDRISEGAVPDPLVTTAEQGAAEVLYGVSGLLARGQNRLVALAYSRLATWLAPGLTEAQLLIAQILHGDSQFEQAIAAYEAIPADAPEALSAQIGKAQALQEAARLEDALTAMRATVERFPDALEAHTALGDMLRRESRFEEAAAAYDRAIALLGENAAPQYWPIFYQRGIAYERSKQWARAEADFKMALKLEPDQPDVLNYLGYSWVERGENLAEAEEMIRTAVKQRPDDGYIVDSLGWVLFRFGEFEKAAEELGRAVELRPVDPVINDHYGDALWMIGRKTEARFQWRRALSFDPEEDDAGRIRKKLDSGLDAVLAAEEAEGQPAVIGRKVVKDDASSDKKAQDGG
jgi:tetratricopeptide (TPR) repeat protein